ncbi:hypothetical protein F5B22DRAFT_637831 [Xylaria bambusicola]|uniref:uncharacterized protein n=1 Tax=Xylaria bambusicola TaxID=326684 RepID=UPI002008779C|nr:uncharacterized protein F5B22DRAFT_637831 [Xylaria bambusicola]KAI0509678.1 hypothetical protein F5B22DRAFT_637831 [Xylaria bambusicola]
MDNYYYPICFGGLVVLCLGLLFAQPTRRQELEQQGIADEDEHPETWWYKAYALAVAADWLQGPYVVALYRDEYSLQPGVVMSLYLTDLIATTVSAYFVGALSDKHGRKLYCMVYCVLYTLSCFLTIVPVTPLLFLGRIFGGISSSILFSVFDSWMVTNFHKKDLAKEACDLSRTYASTAIVNSLVAILTGLLGESLVWATGTKKTPFLVSVALLWVCFQTIWSHWGENFGASSSLASTPAATRPSLWSIIRTPSVLALAFASTMFDSSMNLFALYWGPALSSLHSLATEVPYSTVYSSFMVVSLGAALVFNILMNKRVTTEAQILVAALSVASFCFLKLSSAKTETGAFWLFCLLQGCIGMFVPCVGYLKATLIDDDVRATVYSIMRIPFNILAIISLVTIRDNNNVGGVFATCSLMLIASFTTTLAATLREIL